MPSKGPARVLQEVRERREHSEETNHPTRANKKPHKALRLRPFLLRRHGRKSPRTRQIEEIKIRI